MMIHQGSGNKIIDKIRAVKSLFNRVLQIFTSEVQAKKLSTIAPYCLNQKTIKLNALHSIFLNVVVINFIYYLGSDEKPRQL